MLFKLFLMFIVDNKDQLTWDFPMYCTAENAYKIVWDVASYPQFFPFCRCVVVTPYSSHTMSVDWHTDLGFSFTSHVWCTAHTITAQHTHFTLTWHISGDTAIKTRIRVLWKSTAVYLAQARWAAPFVIKAFQKRALNIQR